MLLYLVAANCSFVALGYNLFYMCKVIMFPSLPLSTLYRTITETGLMTILDLLLLPAICY